MTQKLLPILFIASLFLVGCSDDDDNKKTLSVPDQYTFMRDGSSSVSYSGQTARLLMAEELIDAVKSHDIAIDRVLEMYANQDANGGDVNPFDNADLNASTKSIKSKIASSKDFFSGNTSESAAIKAELEQWMKNQKSEVTPNKDGEAAEGVAGQIADGTKTRYVNAKGLEYDQAVAKSLIGALMADQIANHYISKRLDEGDNRSKNDDGTVEEGKNYTAMEHFWDEGYGYLFGTAANAADPMATVGSDDSFLNKYLGKVNGDSDFAGIAADLYKAFRTGRAAIVAKDYAERDAQAKIIQSLVSKVIGVRAVYYLQGGKNSLTSNKGGAFHDLSEGFGFVYSLRFAKAADGSRLFSKSEVDTMIATLTAGNGFWDITPAQLDAMSETIASKFDFTVAQAGS